MVERTPRYEMRKVRKGWKTVTKKVPRYETRRVQTGMRKVTQRVTEWVTRSIRRPIERWIPGVGRVITWVRERIVEPVTRWVTRTEPTYEKKRVRVGWDTVSERVPNMVKKQVQVGWDTVSERVPNYVQAKVLVGYDVTKKVVPVYKDVTVQEGYEDVKHTLSEGTLRFLVAAWQDGKLKEALVGRFGSGVLKRTLVIGSIVAPIILLLLGIITILSSPGCRESTPTPTPTVTPTITPILTPTITLTPTIDPVMQDTVAYVVACEAGLFEDIPDEQFEYTYQQAVDIAHTMRARINSPDYPNTAIEIVSQGGGTQFNCYGEARNSNIDVERVSEITQALITGAPLPPVTPETDIEDALFFFAPSSYGSRAANQPANYLPQETILANLDQAGICDVDLNTLTEYYAGHSPFNSLGQTTVFFTEFPECYWRGNE